MVLRHVPFFAVGEHIAVKRHKGHAGAVKRGGKPFRPRFVGRIKFPVVKIHKG